MSVRSVFLFLVITMALSSDTPQWQSALIVPELSDKCRHIMCSDKEDPKCIRVKYRKDINNPLFIVAINKCELRFMKCHEHDGYEALLMPMKYCEHRTTKVEDYVNKTNKTVIKREYIRGKREINNEVPKPTLEEANRKASVDYYSDYEEEAGYKIRVQNIYDENQVWSIQKLKLKYSGDPLGKVADESTEQTESTSSEVDKGGNKQSLSLDDDSTDMPLISHESLVTPKVRAVDADTRMEKSCPESCPSRRVMVCAKCQHGVYRTFSSVCHMRMFSCNHNDEPLELVSRYPCILSAPYLSDSNMRPAGKVVDIHDSDPVLKFIRCRSLGKLEGNDPNCQVREGLKLQVF